ncbi:hypothetical protein Micbo1qcDRAFT_70758 [Microdochium bolleyi]|uniref:Uncharacterized protein n=1 Tax=Microdochium bolleyi TaxID=196109 RepID=A0A136J0C6_9PEZI|nr:hypothetical protein Micbo1qcDRAFT_70758 [Microdochium bolleyi]
MKKTRCPTMVLVGQLAPWCSSSSAQKADCALLCGIITLCTSSQGRLLHRPGIRHVRIKMFAWWKRNKTRSNSDCVGAGAVESVNH